MGNATFLFSNNRKINEALILLSPLIPINQTCLAFDSKKISASLQPTPLGSEMRWNGDDGRFFIELLSVLWGILPLPKKHGIELALMFFVMRRSRPMADANTGHMRQKKPRCSSRFYSTSIILYWIGFLTIAIAIAAGMAYLEAEKLSSGIVQGQLLSQYVISYANLLLLGSTFLYVGHLWVTAKSVGQLASGMATLGAMGATVALLVRWFETSHMHQSGHAPLSSLYYVTALFSAVTVVIYLAMEQVYQTRAAGAFVMPIVVGAALFESLQLYGDQGAPGQLAPALKSYWMHAQILSDLVGHGAFAIAAALGIMYLLRERAEKSYRTEGFVMGSLPDLQRIDLLMFEAIVLGFSTYTLGTILGMAWSYAESGEFWSWTREIGTLTVWSIYLAYFYGRYMHQWRGSRMAWLAIIGFVVSVAYFAGISLILTGQRA